MAAHTYDQIKKRVGKNIKYYSDSGGWLTTRDVTEDDIGEIVNDLYREDMFNMIYVQYPHYFRQIAHADNWIATGTVSASSTSTTLVTSTAIFNNSMVGLTVYNSTDDESAVIDAYTNTTTVTLDTTIGDTWDGDTIYVLGQEFAFGGDSTDIFAVEGVGVKYTSSDTYYKQLGVPRPKADIFQEGGEQYSASAPVAYLTTVSVSGTPTDAIGLVPEFTSKISEAIEVTYIGKPAAMSNASDVPRVPDSTPLIYGGTARAFEQRGMLAEAKYWLSRYEKSKGDMMARFRPIGLSVARKPQMPRRVGSMFNRSI